MKLPSSWTTVTTFSKILALALFVALPFIGFYWGYKYKSQINVCPEVLKSEENLENLNLEVLPKRVSWDQIGQEYDVWWDDPSKSLKFHDLVTEQTEKFSANELFNVTGKKDFHGVFKTYGIDSQDESLIIAVGIFYTYELPTGGTTTEPVWVKYSVSENKLTSLPISTTKVLLSKETLYYLDHKQYNGYGSISGYNLASDSIEIEFPIIKNSQLIPVGFSSDNENLMINCFTSESGDFEQDYYFGMEISCGDYLGNFKTEKLIKIQ